MILNPFRLVRRRMRLSRAADEEAAYLRRRYGDAAYGAALKEAERPELTSWGREVMVEAARRLRPEGQGEAQSPA